MKFFFLTFLLFQIIVVKAQLAIIDDPDGFVNVREGKGSNTKIVGKLTNDQSFLYDGENINDQWVMVFFNDENQVNFNLSGNNKAVHLQGFIHRSRLKPITSLPHSGLTKVNRLLTTNHLIIKNDSIFLSVTTRPFNVKNHKILRSNDDCENCAKLFVDKIDGKKPNGVDGGLPTVEISSIKLTIKNMAVDFPSDSFNDLYQPNFKDIGIYFDKNANIYIYMPGNSDGAGGYDLVWVVRHGKLLYRYIDSIG